MHSSFAAGSVWDRIVKGLRSHHKRTAQRFDWKRTETTSSSWSRYACLVHIWCAPECDCCILTCPNETHQKGKQTQVRFSRTKWGRCENTLSRLSKVGKKNNNSNFVSRCLWKKVARIVWKVTKFSNKIAKLESLGILNRGWVRADEFDTCASTTYLTCVVSTFTTPMRCCTPHADGRSILWP